MPDSAVTDALSRLERHALQTRAVVLRGPGDLELRELALPEPGQEDVVVDVEASGVSAGTERLLWTGRMPPFPGLGYPLVPGYESVGTITHAGAESGRKTGERVFVPGARCFGEIRGLFGGAASRLVVAGRRVTPVAAELGTDKVTPTRPFWRPRSCTVPELLVSTTIRLADHSLSPRW